ncbi:tetratricopeptide repeat protein [Helicobacter sp. 11S02596-1]|uniref:tetratricopeptide repeat protein n=1 Tax=Helicobacter sp. 11S02596-1 TaxID=1476194 RepID=UPI000BA58C92|nr:tetratricopeptide repeat protein [Helicobacter sp. 11S02596-1]PAF43631.1 hypothetical protein BJI48_05085 [Helicobacter sp. 11S02596-1]
MKKYYLLISALALLVTGCASSKPDLFKNAVYKEKVLLAAKNYKDLIASLKEELAKKDDPQKRIKLAGYYYQSGDYESTLYYLAPLLDGQKYPEAMFLQAKTLQTIGKKDEALAILEKLLQKSPKMAEAHNLKGIIYAEKKDFKQAKQSFLEAKSLFLKDPIINTNLAMLEILSANYPQAIAYLMPLYARGHKSEKIINNLVLALAKNKDFNAAVEIVQKENLSNSPRNFVRNLYALRMNLDKKN